MAQKKEEAKVAPVEHDPDAANYELKDVKHETIVGYQEQVKK